MRPQVVLNRFLENQDVLDRSKLVPGKLSCTVTVISTRLDSGKQNSIIIFGDSIYCRTRAWEFNNEIKNGYAKFKNFPSSDLKEILNCVNLSLESSNNDSSVLHFKINYLMQKVRSKTDTVENPVENIKKLPEKYIAWSIESFCVGDWVVGKPG